MKSKNENMNSDVKMNDKDDGTKVSWVSTNFAIFWAKNYDLKYSHIDI